MGFVTAAAVSLGPVVEGQIIDEGGNFPPEAIKVSVTIDFEPEMGLPILVKEFTPPVEVTGVNFGFEPYQVVQETDLIIDLQPPAFATDYLLLRWQHAAGGTVVASGQKYLGGNELSTGAVPPQYGIVVVPDPITAKDFILEIDGRYQNLQLAPFSQMFALSIKAVIIRAKIAASGSGYVLVAE